MPDETVPTHVLSIDAVRWSIETLGAQTLHPTFPMYLYLRVQERAGKLGEASASSEELLSLLRMPGNRSKPYYFPLIARGQRTGKLLPTFWRAENISGSWSPGSIGRQMPWLQASRGRYAWPENHVDLARTQMLFDSPVSALAMGAYFLRNDGFVLSEPSARDVIAGFRAKFDYPDTAESEFARLFSTSIPPVEFAWFEDYVAPEPVATAATDEEEPADV